MESDSENEFVDATDYFESDPVSSGGNSRKNIGKPAKSISPGPVPPPRAKKKATNGKPHDPAKSNSHHDNTSDQLCDSSQQHMRDEQDDVVIVGHDLVSSKQDHVTVGQDHMTSVTGEKDHVTSRQDHMVDEGCITGGVDHMTKEDHVITIHHDAVHHSSLLGNRNNDVTDGGNSYDIHRELDEILSKSDLIEGTHLSNSLATSAVATNIADSSLVVKDTSTSITKSRDPQSSPLLASKKPVSLDVPSKSPMSDSQILDEIMVKNLDTGEVVSLKVAQEQIPQGFNPLSLHLMQRTSDFASNTGSPAENPLSASGSTELLDSSIYRDNEVSPKRGRRRGMSKRFKHLFGKSSPSQKAADSKDSNAATLEPPPVLMPSEDESPLQSNPQAQFKYKQSSHYKGSVDFDAVRLKQDLTESQRDAIWAMKFSICGRLLATAGQDKTLYVWVLRSAYRFFYELQLKYARLGTHPSYDSLSSSTNSQPTSELITEEDLPEEDPSKPFYELPICQYRGHKADILDVCWSKNFFLLSASMDKTVRLWHVSRKECLCCFQHVDFVTAIAFHPRDDRYFLSGSLDGKLRLWNIPDKKVALWNEIGDGSNLITAANFCQNGKKVVVGTYDGRCLFFDTEHLKYHTQIHVRSRRGKNSHGSKISGIEPLPGEDKLLITSNDSRVRLYNLRDLTLACKYKGCVNTSSQIKASFSHDGRYVICGSEDHCVYIWKTFPEVTKFPSTRRDRNENYESFTAHTSVVTAAVFAPVPGFFAGEGLKDIGQVLIAADYSGAIKVYVNGSNL